MVSLFSSVHKMQYDAPDVVPCTYAGRHYDFEIDSGDRRGEGGNAIVYKCYNRTDGESLAMKIQLVDEPGPLSGREYRELHLLEKVRHNQLMSCCAAGKVQLKPKRGMRLNCPYIVMPLADKDLMKLRREGQIPASDEVLFGQFRGLSAALEELHKYAVHRDIKPENILIQGTAWILSDFGLCKFLDPDDNGPDLTQSREKVGPKFWMSPEAMNRKLGSGDEITKASDVYQLAAVFWFAATGRHPTGIVSQSDWRGPDSFYKILSLALSHSPSLRPKDGAEFHQMIEDAVLHA